MGEDMMDFFMDLTGSNFDFMGQTWVPKNGWLDMASAFANKYGYGSIPINTIFSGMNIHLPAILIITRGTRGLTHPHMNIHKNTAKSAVPWA
jgi:hypothetical protein